MFTSLQRISELELEVQMHHSAEQRASAHLAQVLDRANALGFGPALHADGDDDSSQDLLPRDPEGNASSFVEVHLPQIQDACRRWLLTSATLVSESADSWRRPADRGELLRCLGESRRLVQQQQQVRRPS